MTNGFTIKLIFNLAVLGLILSLMGGCGALVFGFAKKKELESWTPASGLVENIRKVSDAPRLGKNRRPTYEVTVRYVRGTDVFVKSDLSKEEYPVGSQVGLHYNPQAPDQFRLTQNMQTWLPPTLLWSCAALFVLSIGGILSTENRVKRLAQ